MVTSRLWWIALSRPMISRPSGAPQAALAPHLCRGDHVRACDLLRYACLAIKRNPLQSLDIADGRISDLG